MKNKFLYRCIDCDSEYESDRVHYLCPSCAKNNTPKDPPRGVLKVVYDYKAIRESNQDIKELFNKRLLDLMPIESFEHYPKLKVGDTPMYAVSSIDGININCKLFVKDDSQNPTYSFKDRASALVSAFAKEQNLPIIVAASTGNAGSSLAGICASQHQKAIIIVPSTAPIAKLTQIIMYGAKIVPVDGNYDSAFDLSIEATKEYGWYNRNTAYNPLTIEGKKTVSFEIFEQLGFKSPDAVFVPVGDGVIVSSVFKGFEELMELGFIEKMPTIVAVQAAGSDNIIRNLNQDLFISLPSETIADSISVDIPRNFYFTKQYMKTYNGESIIVRDSEILQASRILAKNTGLFAEPASSAAFAGFLSFNKQNKIKKDSINIILSTGSGLKDLKSVNSLLNMPKPILPQIKYLKNDTNDYV